METTVKKPSKELKDELISLLLKKAGITKRDLYKYAEKRWATQNLDLLTKDELQKYQSIIL
jgi:hypothetical protein